MRNMYAQFHLRTEKVKPNFCVYHKMSRLELSRAAAAMQNLAAIQRKRQTPNVSKEPS